MFLTTFWNYIRSIVCPYVYNLPICDRIFLISNDPIFDSSPNEQAANFNLKDFKFNSFIYDNKNCTVKKAVHKRTRKRVAIKIVPSQEIREEVQNLRTLNGCTYIVKYYGNIINKNQTFIIMELMGFSLKDLIKCSHEAEIYFEEELLSCIAVRITKALNYCKEQNVIHRDVKPANILLNWQGKIKLGDFGMSKNIEISLAKSAVGTRAYWPPEIYQNPGEPYDSRFDVWAIGITLLECIYGNLEFISETRNYARYQDIVKNIYDPHIWIDQVFSGSSYSLDLRNFISNCVTLNEQRAHVTDLLRTNLYDKNKIKCDLTISNHLKKYQVKNQNIGCCI